MNLPYMNYQRLGLLGVLILLSVWLSSYYVERFVSQQHQAITAHNSLARLSPVGKRCHQLHKLKWGPAQSNFTNSPVTSNPFAKGDEAHCRVNSQCRSGKCNNWFCA